MFGDTKPAMWGGLRRWPIGQADRVNIEHPNWRIWTEDGGLAWADPGEARPALRNAVGDCASTLSPVGGSPRLSTYWVDLLLAGLERPGDREVAHGNLWVLRLTDEVVEVRMDVDPPTSDPLDVVTVDELTSGLRALREEVLARLALGHELDERWSQMNP